MKTDVGKILVVEDLMKCYGTGENMVRAVDHTSLEIERGKFTAIVGRSGSGKSTLLHLLSGFDKPTKGTVSIGGKGRISLLLRMRDWQSFEGRRSDSFFRIIILSLR